MKVACEKEIIRPPEVVFPWIAVPEKAMKWQKNVKRSEIIVSKPEMVGTKFNELIEEGGRSLEMQGIITKFVENKNIGFHLKSKIHECDVNYSLEATNSSTKVLIEAIIKWKFPLNIISLLMGQRMQKKITRQMESELVDLKK